MKTSELATLAGLTITTTRITERTNITPDDWHKNATHYSVKISNAAGFTLETEYSMGAAHRRWKKDARLVVYLASGYTESEKNDVQSGERIQQKYMNPKTLHLRDMVERFAEPMPPELDDVLYSLAMDAMGYDNARDFTDWANEYGYDTDSRSAERIYNECARIAKQMRHLIGKHYEQLSTIEE